MYAAALLQAIPELCYAHVICACVAVYACCQCLVHAGGLWQVDPVTRMLSIGLVAVKGLEDKDVEAIGQTVSFVLVGAWLIASEAIPASLLAPRLSPCSSPLPPPVPALIPV
jgi:hypothetical protein